MQRFRDIVSRTNGRAESEAFPLPVHGERDLFQDSEPSSVIGTPQRKEGLPRQGSNSVPPQRYAPQSYSAIAEEDARNRNALPTRPINELVLELQRALAVSNIEERNASLGAFLSPGSAAPEGSIDDGDVSSRTVSTLPPPYSPDGEPPRDQRIDKRR